MTRLNQSDLDELDKVTANITAPILLEYVWWVLKEAQSLQIKQLYFLARDGYILHKIACLLCEKYHIKIACRYIYCSRYSLRIPSLHLIGDECYSLILGGGHRLSPKIILSRAALSATQRREVYQNLGLDFSDEEKILTRKEYENFAKKLKACKVFKKYLVKQSKASYNAAIGYLKQEGLTDGGKVGIVDVGWTGSIQRTLRQLLDSADEQAELTGFYFGMFKSKKSTADGGYKTFYFNHKTRPDKVAKFNNNLFECICSAPHGMTIGYKESAGKYLPILSAYEENPFVIANCNAIYRCCISLIDSHAFGKLNRDLIKKFTALNYRPTLKQASLFANFNFCDDVGESYLLPLAGASSPENLRQLSIFSRLFNLLFKNSLKDRISAPIFWAYGEIALSKQNFFGYKSYLRLNIFIWEMVRIWLKYR